ncbi:MAG: 30S ribosomal protein S20, partial [Pseudomonadota bacterium]|nr:30S ribosomal protein S20 [Pseudomonadota bacterium]
MANSRAAKKRVRQNDRRSIRNRARRSRVRSYLRKVEEAIA